MAKVQHPLEMAMQRFDETVKMYFGQIDKSFRGVEPIPPPKQKKSRGTGIFESPFNQNNREIM